jgi:hypothetical protein
MQIDSTPLDVLVRLDDGVVGKAELTGMIDVATRTVTAAVPRPATKPVDASVLLARAGARLNVRHRVRTKMHHSVEVIDRLLSVGILLGKAVWACFRRWRRR